MNRIVKCTIIFVAIVAICFLFTGTKCIAQEINLSVKTFIPGMEASPGNRAIQDLALSPDGSTLYAAYWTDTSSDPIVAYSTSDYSVIDTISYGRCHGGVDVSNDGRYVYATTYYQGDVSRFDRNNGNARTSLSVGSWATTTAKTPDGTKLVVGSGHDDGHGPSNVYVFDISAGNFSSLGSVSLSETFVDNHLAFSIDSQYVYLTTNTKLYEISTNGSCAVNRFLDFPSSADGLLGVAAGGNNLFVSDAVNNKIWIVDKSIWGVTDYIDVSSAPGTIAMHPDGNHLFVLNPLANSTTVFDITTKQMVDSIENLASFPNDVVFSQDGQYAYVSHFIQNNEAGITVLNIPEPATILLLTLGGIILRKKR
jgi:DNA-binding beta-propeller fold protein YncE